MAQWNRSRIDENFCLWLSQTQTELTTAFAYGSIKHKQNWRQLPLMTIKYRIDENFCLWLYQPQAELTTLLFMAQSNTSRTDNNLCLCLSNTIIIHDFADDTIKQKENWRQVLMAHSIFQTQAELTTLLFMALSNTSRTDNNLCLCLSNTIIIHDFAYDTIKQRRKPEDKCLRLYQTQVELSIISSYGSIKHKQNWRQRLLMTMSNTSRFDDNFCLWIYQT